MSPERLHAYILATHKRPALLRACLASILAQQVPDGWAVRAWVVGAPTDPGAAVVAELGAESIAWIPMGDNRVWRRWNAARLAARDVGARIVSMIGDDDLASPLRTRSAVEALADGYARSGPGRFLMIHPGTGQVTRWIGPCLRAGAHCNHDAELLDRLHGWPEPASVGFPNINKSLDFCLQLRWEQAGLSRPVADTGALVGGDSVSVYTGGISNHADRWPKKGKSIRAGSFQIQGLGPLAELGPELDGVRDLLRGAGVDVAGLDAPGAGSRDLLQLAPGGILDGGAPEIPGAPSPPPGPPPVEAPADWAPSGQLPGPGLDLPADLARLAGQPREPGELLEGEPELGLWLAPGSMLPRAPLIAPRPVGPPSVALATICLNEAAMIRAQLRQHLCWPGLAAWIWVEGAAGHYAQAHPDAVSAEGLSVDGTTELLQQAAQEFEVIHYLAHGLADGVETRMGDQKRALRNRYCEVLDRLALDVEVLVVLDADEYYSQADQAELAALVKRAPSRSAWSLAWRDLWRPPSLAAWPLWSLEVVGGYWAVPHVHVWRWAPGARHGRAHTRLDLPGAPHDPAQCYRGRPGDPECVHLGFAREPAHRRRTNAYYLARGEGAEPGPDNRRSYVECRAAWETWRPGTGLPHGAHVRRYDGPIPEALSYVL